MVTKTRKGAQTSPPQLQKLQARLDELEQTIRAIRAGEVDAVVVSAPAGDRVFTLQGADHVYRVLVEAINEGAATLDANGLILYANGRFAEIAQMRLTRLLAETESPKAMPALVQAAPETALSTEQQRLERERQEAAKAEKLAAEKRQQEEQQRQEEQKRLEAEHAERERVRIAELQRLAAERKQLEELQLQEQRRREEEQKAIEAKRRQEQERLDKERQRIAESERLAEKRRQQEEQRLLADKKQQALEAETRQQEAQEQRRLEQERAELERIRLDEAQRLAVERKAFEEQQAAEAKRRQEEQQAAEAKRRQEQERLERENRRIAEAERQAAERRQQEEQRLLAEHKRLAQEKREREEKNRLEAERLAVENKRREHEMAALAAKSSPAAISGPVVVAAPSSFMINIGSGLPVPELMAPSNNPFSAGRYPLARKYSVGDYFEIRTYDIFSKVGPTVGLTVTSVDNDADRVEINGGESIWDTMGNIIKAPGYGLSDVPRQFHPAELQVGKKWAGCWRVPAGFSVVIDFHVIAFESVRVPAGEFKAFIVTFDGWDQGGNRLSHHKGVLWIVPGLNISIRHEHEQIGRRGRSYCHELVSLKQKTMEAGCTSMTAGHPNMVVKNLAGQCL